MESLVYSFSSKLSRLFKKPELRILLKKDSLKGIVHTRTRGNLEHVRDAGAGGGGGGVAGKSVELRPQANL